MPENYGGLMTIEKTLHLCEQVVISGLIGDYGEAYEYLSKDGYEITSGPKTQAELEQLIERKQIGIRFTIKARRISRW
jgi:hypothetical protein